MAVYNMSFLDNSTNILEIGMGLNSIAGYPIIGDLTILCFFVIYMVLAYRENFSEVLVTGGFATTILATLLYSAGLASLTSVLLPSFTFLFMLAFILLRRT
mgnify:FL=1|jgi:hypothetical protein